MDMTGWENCRWHTRRYSGPKTALLLEPFKWEFGDLYPTVGADLYSKGYAVTDYSNAGVTWNKVYQLPQNTVSLIWTHGVGTENTKGHITSSYGLQISDIGEFRKTNQSKYLYTINTIILMHEDSH